VRALLALLLLLIPFTVVGQDYIVAGPRPRGAPAEPQITQFFTGTRGEPDNAPYDGETHYSTPFGDSNRYTTTEGEAFGVFPVAGTLTNLYLSNANGELDASEEVVGNIRECDGGDVSSCSWGATSPDLTVTATGAGGTADTIWGPDTSEVAVAAGDVFGFQQVMGADAPDGGGAENVRPYVEFTPDASNTWVMHAYHRTGATANFYWAASGHNVSMLDSAAKVAVPLAAAATPTAMACAMNADPGAAIDFYLCKVVTSGGDASCGGAAVGEELMTVQVAASGSSRSNISTTCTGSGGCVLAAEDQIYLRQSDDSANNETACGIAFEGDYWQTCTSHEFGFATSIAFAEENFSTGSGTRNCNSSVGELNCGTQLPSAITAVAMAGRMSALMDSTDTAIIALREDQADCGMSVTFTDADQTPTSSAGCAFDANDDVNMQERDGACDGSCTGDTSHGACVAWESLN
jgi:hypothetical protein